MVVLLQIDHVTNKIYEITKTLKSYKIASDINIDIDKIQSTTVQVDGKEFTVDVIDSVNDYLEHMKDIFDFSSIKQLIQGSNDRSTSFQSPYQCHEWRYVCMCKLFYKNITNEL